MSTRRDFVKISALATAGASLAACGTDERILPALTPDPRNIPGRPQYFATVCRECPAGCGMLVRVNDGRPTKVEGNPEHPINRGGLCVRGHSSLQGLYNPDRIRQPLLRDARGRFQPATWDAALALWVQQLRTAMNSGAEIAWLGHLESGTLSRLITAWIAAVNPRANSAAAPLFYEYFSHDALRRAQAMDHGRAVVPAYRIDRARYLLNFGADFLETWISNVEYAGDFAAMRSLGHTDNPARSVYVGSRLGLTGANADEFWPARPGTEHLIAWALVATIEHSGAAPSIAAAAAASGVPADVIETAAARLQQSRPSLVLPPSYSGDTAAALSCHQAVNRLNRALGNEGVTVLPDQPHALSAAATQAEVLTLLQRAEEGQIGVLHLHHANPAYHHPRTAAAFTHTPFTVSFARCMDETTQHAHLVLPDHDPLESWGDYSPRPGVTGLMQPARLPLHDTRPAGDLLLSSARQLALMLPGAAVASTFAALVQNAHAAGPEPLADLLAKGVALAASPAPKPTPPTAPALALPTTAPADFAGDGDWFLTVFPTVQFFDGRQANRSWCQEIADPLSKIVWDGWAELHPDTAARLHLQANDIVRLISPHGEIELPLFVTTWIRPDCVGAVLGQGHANYGMFANGCGDSVHRLQSPYLAAGVWSAQTVKVRLQATGKSRALANLQPERLQRDKKVALAVALAAARAPSAREPYQDRSFYENHPSPVHRWGMAIDLDSCIGCNACQAACYAENNIAVMGRSSCMSHREMTWIRVEVWEGDGAHPSTALHPDLRFIPTPCQQCGNAPCEYVCPVYAAYHTDEGLNAQVYNRCVGTRYCSNNCIYKVRRFNWYTPQWPEPLDQQLNPDVTVRAKGVMEKCTFCVQRIVAAEQDAGITPRRLPDGTIQSACMQTCPTRAITFGDLKIPQSRVSQLANEPRAYRMFADENAYPAVSYLKRVRFEMNAPAAKEVAG